MQQAQMRVELAGHRFRVLGTAGPVADAVMAGLAGNGAVAARESEAAGLVIFSCPLLPDMAGVEPGTLEAVAREGRAMAAGGGGRMVLLLSALAGLPMRRHVAYSAAMAAAAAGMRGLAMELAPKVLVNAVGAGAIGDARGAMLAGDQRMLSHAGLGRAGTIDDLVHAVLFLCDPQNSYTTGQLLNVDGGWSVGYGRNF
jgi:NAD(P)-dependent dehydrogenase (short-subunit alcohol dehydrogenase family)